MTWVNSYFDRISYRWSCTVVPIILSQEDGAFVIFRNWKSGAWYATMWASLEIWYWLLFRRHWWSREWVVCLYYVRMSVIGYYCILLVYLVDYVQVCGLISVTMVWIFLFLLFLFLFFFVIYILDRFSMVFFKMRWRIRAIYI